MRCLFCINCIGEDKKDHKEASDSADHDDDTYRILYYSRTAKKKNSSRARESNSRRLTC